MKTAAPLQKMTSAALLIALGIVIPLFMPKIVLPFASYTLASHVPVFLAMLISPVVAVAVAVGTTLGFLLSGLPLVVVARAATHLIFAFLGALYLARRPRTVRSAVLCIAFSLVLAVVHAACEVLVATPFFVAGGAAMDITAYFWAVVLPVGIGGAVHSMVDFAIALVVFRILATQKALRPLFPAASAPAKPAAQG